MHPRPAHPLNWLFHQPLLWLVLFQALITLIVVPFGNFPLNDDWAYSHSVLWLLEEHRIRLSNWIAMNLLPQTVLGGMASSVFGFSHAVLKGVTQVLAFATSLAAYRFFVVCGMERWHALAAVCLLVSNPWWLLIANSFMSDIYCMFFSVLAATAFVRCLQGAGPGVLAIAIVMSILAVLQRQVAMVLPLAFLLAALFQERSLRINRVALLSLPLVLTGLAGWVYQQYLLAGPGIPAAQQMTHGRLAEMLWATVQLDTRQLQWFFSNMRDISGYVALAVSAWGLAMLGAWQGWRKYWIGLVLLVAAIIIGSLAWDWTLPYRSNNLIDAAGLGPFTLEDGLHERTGGIDREQPGFWRAMSLAVAIGLAALLICLSRLPALISREFRQRHGVGVFLTLILGGYFIPFAVTDFFDRYIIYALPFLLAWMYVVLHDGAKNIIPERLAVVLAAVCMIISVCAAHDYFAWNKARWSAIEIAENLHGANPGNMDAGFEYNGFYNHPGFSGGALGKRWWWVVDDEFLVSFSMKDGYHLLESVPTGAWLPSNPQHILLLRRVDDGN